MSILTASPPAEAALEDVDAHSDSRREALLNTVTVTVACLVFLALCLYQLDLPGLYTDEAFDVVPSMQIVLGHPVELQRGVGIHLFGTDLPLMSSSDYQGITSTYLAIPFFAFLGVSVYSIRLMTTLVGVVALVLGFFLARAWFGANAARLTVLMMAVSPAWVFWSRLGVYVVSPVVPLATGALLALTIWIRRRPFGVRNGPLYVGAFLLGLGMTTKLLFLWFIVSLGVCAAVLYGRVIWEARGIWRASARLWLAVVLAAGGAFTAGALPFLLYNAMTRGTFRLLLSSASSPTTTHGVNNSAFLRNLWTEADAFKVLLDGGYFWFQGNQRVYSNPLTPPLFALSALGLLAFVIIDRSRTSGRRSFSLSAGGILLCIALLAVALAPLFNSGTAHALSLLGMGLGAVSILAIALAALRHPNGLSYAAWWLLAVGAIAGAVWWLGGAGRPDGPDPSGPFGLWPVDGAGVLFWAAGAALIFLLGTDPHPAPGQRLTAGMLAVLGLVVAQSSVTVSGLWSTHLLILLPLPQITIAAFVVQLGRWLSRRLGSDPLPRGRLAATALPAIVAVAAIMAADLYVDYSYHRDLQITGGNSTFSDAIYGLADYLQNARERPAVVAMDWGFKRPIQILTEERVNPIEAYGYSADPTEEFRRGVRQLLQNSNTFYLFHTPESTAYARIDAFMQEVQSAGKVAKLKKIFNHRDGIHAYYVYTVN